MLTALRTPLAWASAAAIAASCGVSGPPPESGGPATPDRPAASSQPSTQAMPLNALLAEVHSGSRAAHDAIEREVARCMEEHGFDYEPSPYRDDYPTRPPLGDAFRSAEHWERDGGSQPRVVGDEREGTQNAGLRGLDDAGKEAWFEALFGDDDDERVPVRNADGQVLAWMPSGGCNADAEREILGPDRTERVRLSLAIQSLQGEVSERIDADPTVDNALTAFVSCMRQAGYDLGGVDNRDDLVEKLGNLRAQGQPRLGDDVVACNSESGLADSLNRADQRAQEAVLEATEGLVVAWREYVARAEQSADADEAS